VITTSPVASVGKTASTVKSSPNTMLLTVTSISEVILDTLNSALPVAPL